MATGFKFLSPRQVAQAEAWRIELTGRSDDTPSADSFEEGTNIEEEFAEVGEAHNQKESDEDGALIDLTTDDGLGDGLVGKHFISLSFLNILLVILIFLNGYFAGKGRAGSTHYSISQKL